MSRDLGSKLRLWSQDCTVAIFSPPGRDIGVGSWWRTNQRSMLVVWLDITTIPSTTKILFNRQDKCEEKTSIESFFSLNSVAVLEINYNYNELCTDRILTSALF